MDSIAMCDQTPLHDLWQHLSKPVPVDLEAMWLTTLRLLIAQSSSEGVESMAKYLAEHVTLGYHEGLKDAAKMTGPRNPLLVERAGTARLTALMDKTRTRLEGVFGQMAKPLTDILDEGIRNGDDVERIALRLKQYLENDYGRVIKFNNIGKQYRQAWVNPDGTMAWRTKTIRFATTMSVDDYANLLADDVSKKAYSQGHVAGYESAGLKKWVYSAVADNCTRPEHLAMHGRVITVGTDEEEQALALMDEANCRCRPKPYFGNSDVDRSSSDYAQERVQAFEKIKGDYVTDGPWGKFIEDSISHARREMRGKDQPEPAQPQAHVVSVG